MRNPKSFILFIPKILANSYSPARRTAISLEDGNALLKYFVVAKKNSKDQHPLSSTKNTKDVQSAASVLEKRKQVLSIYKETYHESGWYILIFNFVKNQK